MNYICDTVNAGDLPPGEFRWAPFEFNIYDKNSFPQKKIHLGLFLLLLFKTICNISVMIIESVDITEGIMYLPVRSKIKLYSVDTMIDLTITVLSRLIYSTDVAHLMSSRSQ